MRLRYNYRLYPGPGQCVALARAFGCARVVYNDGLRAREAARAQGRTISDGDLSKLVITTAKGTPERAWLGAVSAVVLQQALADLNIAYRNFWNWVNGVRQGPKIDLPVFKTRKGRQAVRFTRNARFAITTAGRLSLPKIGPVPVRWSRPLPAEPSSVTVIKDAAGRYFASFVVDVGGGPLPPVADEAGIDLGLTHFAVLSDGTKIDNPRWLRRRERKLKRAQQAFSRTQKGSNNKNKARARVARQHARVADARRDFHHRLSTHLIRDNQAVYVEDLAVHALARTRLAKSVHDAGWSAFVAMLEYKAARHGRTVIRIGRFEPTTQVCSACGVQDGPKPLHIRVWTCAACGTTHDRDINAANNILAAGRAERLNACGGDLRPHPGVADPSETGSHRGAA